MKRRLSKPLTIYVDTPKNRVAKEWNLETSLEKDFEFLATLGRGSIGVVRHARRVSDGKQVALKLIDSKDFELAALEYALLKSLDHRHIIKCYDCIPLESMGQEVLVLEHFDGRNLQQVASNGGAIQEKKARVIFSALLSAVAYLHAKNIIHRDIKAENVLVCTDFSDLRLIDFNTSRRMQDGETPLTMTGTSTWCAPEVLMGNSPSKPNDVWGMGLCLHLMVFGQLPCSWEDITISTYLTRLLKNATDLKQMNSHAVSDECIMALACCLEVDRTVRATAPSLLQNNPFNPIAISEEHTGSPYGCCGG